MADERLIRRKAGGDCKEFFFRVRSHQIPSILKRMPKFRPTRRTTKGNFLNFAEKLVDKTFCQGKRYDDC
jgi:hypothetical protein